MRLRLLRSPSGIRHPGLAVTLAVECKGPCAGLSGTLRDLTRAATAGARARRMIFALHYPGPISQRNRARPVMAGVPSAGVGSAVGSQRRLLAYECEANRGCTSA